MSVYGPDPRKVVEFPLISAKGLLRNEFQVNRPKNNRVRPYAASHGKV